MLVNILLGLAGLGIVVFVHELGHFVAAKAVGVQVEAFSLGWGPRLVGFKRKGTDYRISVFPLGGFCAMKGEDAFKKAIERDDDEMPREPGSFYGAAPWRRIVISAAGPVFNLVFAALVFAVVYGIGLRYDAPDARIVLASDSAGAARDYPADAGGLRTGDVVVAIDGAAIPDFSKLQERVSVSAGKTLAFTVDRSGERLELRVTPRLDRKRGIGVIGIRAWVDPLVLEVEKNGAAAFAGLLPGDLIVGAQGAAVATTAALYDALRGAGDTVDLSLIRNGVPIAARLAVLDRTDGLPDLGVSFEVAGRIDRSPGFLPAAARGVAEAAKTLSLTLRGLGSLFTGADLMSVVSGPARITYIVGEVASRGFETGLLDGLVSAFNFLALLSIGLFVMNLLPIPALDGGQILLFLAEAVRKRPLKLRTVLRYQTVGMTLILAIFVMSTLADVLFFTKR